MWQCQTLYLGVQLDIVRHRFIICQVLYVENFRDSYGPRMYTSATVLLLYFSTLSIKYVDQQLSTIRSP